MFRLASTFSKKKKRKKKNPPFFPLSQSNPSVSSSPCIAAVAGLPARSSPGSASFDSSKPSAADLSSRIRTPIRAGAANRAKPSTTTSPASCLTSSLPPEKRSTA